MNPGDLVHYKAIRRNGDQNYLGAFGLIVGWYDKPQGYADVMWWWCGKIHFSPCHVSKLEIFHEI